ncbi:putative 2-aminoethylphosphonate ABC transporter permease subunit [Variovorax sp. J22P240]|uniref:putative 2-aminoethylphosphonate ABC transporter permease subunit n=1 Tax=Variovorax sp. J22P240 TaxID=3053514 RepID=UPI002574F404|nr:putative 2-aminoethylphosphonate ABC transporter permease subunit [Variovorax sp. J22P240]MDM0000902.1 putative 2-aminoethylphosphonate ABC transporter permease subunit [Variovorax sp. J22P240]
MSTIAARTTELPRQRSAFDRDRWLTGAAVLLAGAVLIVIVALPVGALVGQSFFDRAGAFVGLANFAHYVDNPALVRSAFNSVWLAVVSAALCTGIAYVYAYGLTLSCMRGKGLLRAIALMPLLAPSLLPAISLVYLFGNQGVFKGWLGDVSIYGPLGIVLGSVFWTLPHALLILTTAMATSDGRLYEAAQTLGASRWRIFRTVTLPASRYGLIVAGMVVFVLVITDFGVPKVVGGQTGVLATDIYKQVVGQQNFQMGAVVGFVLLIPAVLSFLVERRVRRRQAAALSARATLYVPEPMPVRDRALLAACLLIAFCIVVMIGMAVFASLATYWPYKLAPSLKNYDFSNMDGGGWGSYFNSLRLAVGAAVVGAIATFVSAYLVEKPRHFVLLREVLNLLANLPLAVPGLVLGVGYIFFFNAPSNPLRGLYGGMAILVICTVAHFFSVAHLTSLTALRQLDREYELVSESMGVPFWRTLWRVHLPVALPTVLDVAGYFFVNAMTTVSAVVFLYAPQTTLAAIAVLNMDDAGDVAPAAAMASLIMLTAALGRGLFALAGRSVLARTQAWRSR